MQMTFQVEQLESGDRVHIVGPIDEDSDHVLAVLKAQLSDRVVFNFRQVTHVNSCGVRAWINFLRDVEADRQIVFEECTPEIINQINMIPNFRGKASITSLYATYSCPECEHQQWHKFQQGENFPESPDSDIEEVACEKCGATMEMEELEDEFFDFLLAS